ncbi:LysR substrate-binding domain-containing protein [Synechococcus sp. A10-1-5-1]|uniref:LysR family transcriptional regulator substrate-binding protein n=1 Tax=Synechococcus sp. A10-1-5-1 TaxID=2936507 RepID=UPI0020016B6E|nr:LysR substrate-binding domain-containing protein [Synechococcus sp. A10-1-5-1]UPM50213.1 LysR substrate-binding domain-containing protein [Synechococcus sp. A10-1-5-1]
MITVDDLKCLDMQIWLRSGEECAKRLFVTQSTISRRNAETQKTLGIWLKRDQFGEWQEEGDTTFLDLERETHQLYRLTRDDERLRLEATFWAGPALATPEPAGWMNGVWDHLGMVRPLRLLKKGIIDAWIGSYQPDLPSQDDPDFCVIDLCTTPVRLVANKLHPLANKKDISREDLEAFPALSLPDSWFPRTEECLRSHGLWSTEARMKRYKRHLWDGQTEDQATLCYATCLGLDVMKDLTVLDYDLNLLSGESLVVKRTLMDHQRIRDLVSCLKERVLEKSAVHSDLIPCF